MKTNEKEIDNCRNVLDNLLEASEKFNELSSGALGDIIESEAEDLFQEWIKEDASIQLFIGDEIVVRIVDNTSNLYPERTLDEIFQNALDFVDDEYNVDDEYDKDLMKFAEFLNDWSIKIKARVEAPQKH